MMKVYTIWLHIYDYDACPVVCAIASSDADARQYALETIPSHDIELWFGYTDTEYVTILPFNADGKAIIRHFSEDVGYYIVEETPLVEKLSHDNRVDQG